MSEDKPEVMLVGQNGNAFAVLGACRQAARNAGWATERWEAVREQMTSGDYEHLLQVAMREFDVY